MWLECMGVVSGWCCKEVYKFSHFTFPYSTCISSFLAAASLLLCSFLKMFFRSCLLFVISCLLCFVLYNIANVVHTTFEIVQKSRSRGHSDIIISTRTCVDYESQDFHV